MREEKPTITEKKWEHAGLKCHVAFVRQSHRCGYVTVPKGHIAYGKNYDDLPIDVHGGLTYGDVGESNNPDEETFGFDCAHLGDATGELGPLSKTDHFWTLEEVVAETNRMAEQFQALTIKAIMEHKIQWMPDWFKENIASLCEISTKTENLK